MSHFLFNMFKTWYLMYQQKMKTRIYSAPAVKGLMFLEFKCPLFDKPDWEGLLMFLIQNITSAARLYVIISFLTLQALSTTTLSL